MLMFVLGLARRSGCIEPCRPVLFLMKTRDISSRCAGPQGASLEYTTQGRRRAQRSSARTRISRGILGAGIQFQTALRRTGGSSSRICAVQAERKGEEHSAQSIIEKVRGPLMDIGDGL